MNENKPKMYIKEGQIPTFYYDMVSLPKEGGSLCKIEGTDIWVKWQANINQVIYQLDLLKRVLKLTLKFVGKNPIKILGFVFNWRKLLGYFNQLAEVSLRRLDIDLIRYCVSARELLRVADKITTENIKNVDTRKQNKILEKINKSYDLLELFIIILTFYEYDMAYRWRSQFALGLIDKVAFLKDPYKEIKRIHSEMVRREKDLSLQEKYKIFEKLLWIFKVPFIKKLSKVFVEEMDMDKIRLDSEDMRWLNSTKSEFDFN